MDYQLTEGPLGWREVLSLGSSLHESDLREIEGSPFEALLHGTRHGGNSWAVNRGDTVLGAFGWTKYATIWSLWGDLDRKASREILSRTPHWVSLMIWQAIMGGHRNTLHNYIHTGNTRSLGWLHASKCFKVDTIPVIRNGLECFYFETKPLAEIEPYV